MLLSVSVDLDEIPHYRAIHGLGGSDGYGVVFERAVPRLSDWARQRGVPLTWFVVGRDLEVAAHAEAMRRVSTLGDELGTHSFSHRYDLTRLPYVEMRSEVEQGVTAIQRATGARVAGFRAPGYTVSDTLLEIVRDAGLEYDSSVFPCPPYYGAKVLAMARIRAKGRASRAVLDVPEVLRAPTEPYRVGRPYWFRGDGIWEVPVQVTRGLKLPFIGTALALARERGARLLAQGVAGLSYVNLELHGVDALDDGDPHLADLAPHQRDLRIPWPKKLAAIDAAVTWLLGRGYGAVRLEELARRSFAGR